jgi:hypothetical protein
MVAGGVAGDLADFTGQLTYVNRRHRWNWALAAAQVAYRSGALRGGDDPDAGEIVLERIIHRQLSSEAFGLTIYPFSSSTRLELAGGARKVSFSEDITMWRYSQETSALVERRRFRESLGPSLYVAETSAAVVHDTSFHGATGPVIGTRARLQIGQSAGTLQYSSLLLDVRRYVMPVRPVTIAVRGLHYGRYGRDAEYDRLPELFLGYPELVRGYGVSSFAPVDCREGAKVEDCFVFEQLLGSRLAVGNVEVRAPLVGLFRGEIDYGRIPVELAGFFDAGVAWTKDTRPSFAGGTRTLVRSAGAAVRANAFGLLLVEIAAARPLDRPGRGFEWQIGIRGGF